MCEKYKSYSEAVEYKLKTGMSYDEIARKIEMDRTGVCYNTRMPARTNLKTFLRIANAIKMPRGEAIELWRRAKSDYEMSKIDKSVDAV